MSSNFEKASRSTALEWAAFAPLTAVLIWSGNTIVTKAAAVVIEPASITLYRWLLAFLLLTPFVGRAAWRQRSVIASHWPKLALLGGLGMATYQGLAYVAARSTTAVDMGVILALMPLLSAFLANVFAAEALSGKRVLGMLISLAGVIVLITQGKPDALWHDGVHGGDVLMLVAVAANAFYGVLLKRWASHWSLSTWQQLYVQIGFGVLILVPFWLAEPISSITPANAPLILYAAIPASLGAPYFWMKGIKALGPAHASLFMNLLPVFVALLAWTLLGERIHAYQVIGGLITLSGVIVVGLQRARAEA